MILLVNLIDNQISPLSENISELVAVSEFDPFVKTRILKYTIIKTTYIYQDIAETKVLDNIHALFPWASIALTSWKFYMTTKISGKLYTQKYELVKAIVKLIFFYGATDIIKSIQL